MPTYSLYFDGASKNNGSKYSRAGSGSVIYSGESDKFPEIWCDSQYLGCKTNNEAEYTGLINGLKKLSTFTDIDKCYIYGDSNLVIKQMSGIFKVRSTNLIPLFNEAKGLSQTNYQYIHILRHLNTRADFLSNEKIDNREFIIKK